MVEKAVAIREDKQVAIQELETRFAMAVRQRELLEKYIQERLKPDKHYYTISEGQKSSLTKEGAELICLPHSLKPHYQILSGPEQPTPDNSSYQITVKCELEAPSGFAGEGIGSASSYQTSRAGEYKPRQKDPGLCHNATLKMAQKSSYISATLNATAASEFFTQDLEDAQTGEVESKGEKKTDHWCSEHGVAFRKITKGDKTWYAHKTADGWCNEAKVKSQQTQDEPPMEEEIPVEETQKPDPTKLFWAICRKLGFTSQHQVFEELSVSDMPQLLSIKTLEEALDFLARIRGKDWRSL